jgi:uncharacterized DUF497 family protein
MSKAVQYVFRGVTFEWDPDKANSNLAKHGVTFEDACEVFFDPFLRVVDAAATDEARDAVIGYTASQYLLYVVHLVRHEEAIRIISARRATPQERHTYEQW